MAYRFFKKNFKTGAATTTPSSNVDSGQESGTGSNAAVDDSNIQITRIKAATPLPITKLTSKSASSLSLNTSSSANHEKRSRLKFVRDFFRNKFHLHNKTANTPIKSTDAGSGVVAISNNSKDSTVKVVIATSRDDCSSSSKDESKAKITSEKPKHVNKDHENKIKVLNANLKEKLLKSKMNDKITYNMDSQVSEDEGISAKTPDSLKNINIIKNSSFGYSSESFASLGSIDSNNNQLNLNLTDFNDKQSTHNTSDSFKPPTQTKLTDNSMHKAKIQAASYRNYRRGTNKRQQQQQQQYQQNNQNDDNTNDNNNFNSFVMDPIEEINLNSLTSNEQLTILNADENNLNDSKLINQHKNVDNVSTTLPPIAPSTVLLEKLKSNLKTPTVKTHNIVKRNSDASDETSIKHNSVNMLSSPSRKSIASNDSVDNSKKDDVINVDHYLNGYNDEINNKRCNSSSHSGSNKRISLINMSPNDINEPYYDNMLINNNNKRNSALVTIPTNKSKTSQLYSKSNDSLDKIESEKKMIGFKTPSPPGTQPPSNVTNRPSFLETRKKIDASRNTVVVVGSGSDRSKSFDDENRSDNNDNGVLNQFVGNKLGHSKSLKLSDNGVIPTPSTTTTTTAAAPVVVRRVVNNNNNTGGSQPAWMQMALKKQSAWNNFENDLINNRNVNNNMTTSCIASIETTNNQEEPYHKGKVKSLIKDLEK